MLVTTALPGLHLTPVNLADFDALFNLRQAAMQESAQALGQMHAARIKQALAAQFDAKHAWHIVWYDTRVGWFGWQSKEQIIWLEHFYILPQYQNLGIGTMLLQLLCQQADLTGQYIQLTALRGSRANTFYARFGFELISSNTWDCLFRRAPYSTLVTD